MSFLHRMTLKSKLFMLSFFILASLIIIAGVGYNNISAMKRNLDALYFGSLTPISTLNSISNLYNESLKDRYYKVTSGTLSPHEAAHGMSQALTQIKTLWNSYTRSYKEEKELPYIEYTSRQIEQSEAYFLKVIESCYQGCSSREVPAAQLISHIRQVQQAIENLIHYENEVAKYERHRLLENYDATLFRITVIIIIVIIVIMVLSFIVFKSINHTQNQLKLTTQQLKVSNKKLEEASFTDSLTTLYNRRYFNMLFERELARAKRTKSIMVFMMLDIDYFKQYNDTYGHLEGDNALKTVAQTLKKLLKRPGDYVFRLGGEEFGIMLVDTDLHNAKVMAEQIVTSIREQEIPHASSKASDFLTVSLGVIATRPANDFDGDRLLSEADKNLYEAKESGRNRFVLHELKS